MDKQTEERFLNPEVQMHLKAIRDILAKKNQRKFKRKTDAKRTSR